MIHTYEQKLIWTEFSIDDYVNRQVRAIFQVTHINPVLI